MIRRFLDIVLALAGLIILLPLFLFISAVILISSGLPVFYVQSGLGKTTGISA
jgi:lipopolysaccharide/colanic/teichoic acid biosynthesis glycosyltransferase